jgi:4-oxalocrotonate tautomerase
MPIINVAVTGNPDARLSAAIAGEISEITATHLKKDPAVTAVAVSYIEPQH